MGIGVVFFEGRGEEIKDCSHVRKADNYVCYVGNYAKLSV